jgi:hypothetical protein
MAQGLGKFMSKENGVAGDSNVYVRQLFYHAARTVIFIRQIEWEDSYVHFIPVCMGGGYYYGR